VTREETLEAEIREFSGMAERATIESYRRLWREHAQAAQRELDRLKKGAKAK
jgi:hypothetical protein